MARGGNKISESQMFYYYIDNTTRELVVRYNGKVEKKFSLNSRDIRHDLWVEYGPAARYLFAFIVQVRLNSIKINSSPALLENKFYSRQ